MKTTRTARHLIKTLGCTVRQAKAIANSDRLWQTATREQRVAALAAHLNRRPSPEDLEAYGVHNR